MNAVEVKNLTKIYRLYKGSRQQVKGFLTRKRTQQVHEARALDDVSFTIGKGKTVGIIGRNGSGKSTLLKIITGVLRQTSGKTKVSGRVAALLELGAGFKVDFTGRENVYMAGAINGFEQNEIEQRIPEIEAFADIGTYFDQPFKTYSSGMRARLGFAVAINVDPDILIIDEALAVGDDLFRIKCYQKFQEFQEKGITILFVTHAINLVTTHCNEALLLDKGKLVNQGSPKTIVDDYRRLLAAQNGSITPKISKQPVAPSSSSNGANVSTGIEWRNNFKLNPNENRYGNRRAEILEAGIFTAGGEPAQILTRSQEYVVKVKIQFNEDTPAPIVAFTLKDIKGTILCGTNTFHQNTPLTDFAAGEIALVTFRFTLLLNPGQYLFSAGVSGHEGGEIVVYDRRFDYFALKVVADQPRPGFFDPQAEIEWKRVGKAIEQK